MSDRARDEPWVTTALAAHADSDRLAAYDAAVSFTGRDLVRRAAGAAALLADLGVDGVVPALLTTNARSLALLLGGARTGRPLAPLGPRLTARELAGPVAATGAPVLLTEPAFAEHAAEVADLCGISAHVLGDLPDGGTFDRAPGDVGVVLHTSGTTGAAKPVPLTQQVLATRAAVLLQVTGITAESRYATGSPLHHIGGMGTMLAAVTAGAGVVSTDRFTTDWWLDIAGLGVTHCLLVPTMIEMLLSAGLLDRVRLQTLIYGASPISPATLAKVMDTLPGVELVNLFGQTEGSPLTVLTKEDHRRALTGRPDLLTSVGRAAPGLQVRLDDPDGRGVGEICARGPHLSRPGPDGWLHTGDVGSIDAEGYVHLTGRLHDMIVRGGENVYPVEVENVLTEHPAVREAAVVGVPDPRLGETLAAFVVAESAVSHDELAAWVRSRLAGFKVPQHWHDVAELPYSSAGKLLRRVLRERSVP